MRTTFFSELAGKSPIVIYNNQLYQVVDGDGDDFVSVGNQRFALVPSSELAELETFHRDLHAQEIFDYKQQFVRDRLNEEMRSQGQMDQYTGAKKIVHFIFRHLFPLFMDDDVDSLLTGTESTERSMRLPTEERIRVTQEHIEALKRELAGEQMRSEDDNGLETLVSGYYQQQGGVERQTTDGLNMVFTLNDAVYGLVPSEDANGMHVCIGGNTFNLVPRGHVRDVDRAYFDELYKKFRLESLDEFEDQLGEIQKIREETKALEKFLGIPQHEVGDVGFLKQTLSRGGDGPLFFYTKIPKFAMKHPEYEQYHAFEACKVAVHVRYDKNRDKIYAGRVWVLDEYAHPFLRDFASFQPICMGPYQLADAESPEGIAKYLSDAVNTIMHGYTLGCGPYHRLGGFRTISFEDAMEQKYLITNIHDDR